MSLRMLRRYACAVWLGVIALAIDALVPIHVALDLAEAFGASRPGARAADRSFEWRLFALAAGHRDAAGKADGDDDRRHHQTCAVCSALGALAGFGPAAAVGLAVPASVEAPVNLVEIAATPAGPRPAAYRSRAPPLG
jgi:hypothetical protein